MKSQPIDDHTLDALNLPDDFLRRVGDRVIRMDYQRHFRSVAKAAAGGTAPTPATAPTAPTGRVTPVATGGVTVVIIAVAAAAARRRRKRKP